jgi:hypothetical protein
MIYLGFISSRGVVERMVLEEEIKNLRSKLEMLVSGGADMTSEAVIEISGLLDLKIIEYMKECSQSR